MLINIKNRCECCSLQGICNYIIKTMPEAQIKLDCRKMIGLAEEIYAKLDQEEENDGGYPNESFDDVVNESFANGWTYG